MEKGIILFCIDEEALENCRIKYPDFDVAWSYDATKKLIKDKKQSIITLSLINLSEFLWRTWDLFICYREKVIEIKRGMTLARGGILEDEPDFLLDHDGLIWHFNRGDFNKELGI